MQLANMRSPHRASTVVATVEAQVEPRLWNWEDHVRAFQESKLMSPRTKQLAVQCYIILCDLKREIMSLVDSMTILHCLSPVVPTDQSRDNAMRAVAAASTKVMALRSRVYEMSPKGTALPVEIHLAQYLLDLDVAECIPSENMTIICKDVCDTFKMMDDTVLHMRGVPSNSRAVREMAARGAHDLNNVDMDCEVDALPETWSNAPTVIVQMTIKMLQQALVKVDEAITSNALQQDPEAAAKDKLGTRKRRRVYQVRPIRHVCEVLLDVLCSLKELSGLQLRAPSLMRAWTGCQLNRCSLLDVMTSLSARFAAAIGELDWSGVEQDFFMRMSLANFIEIRRTDLRVGDSAAVPPTTALSNTHSICQTAIDDMLASLLTDPEVPIKTKEAICAHCDTRVTPEVRSEKFNKALREFLNDYKSEIKC